MNCHYCGKRLPISKVLRGHTFCSLEHQELYLSSDGTEAFDRLRESFDASPPRRPKSKQARQGTDLRLIQPDQPHLEPLGTPQPAPAEERVQEALLTPEVVNLMDAVAETPVAGSQSIDAELQHREGSSADELTALMEGLGGNIEPQPAEAGFEDNSASPALVVSPIESAQTTAASDLPEAGSLFGLSSVDQPAFSLKGPGAEPISGSIQLPATTGRASVENSSPAIVDISETLIRKPVDAGPMPSYPTWRNVAPGYPPVIAWDSTTLLVDPKAGDFVPVSTGKPYPGEAPPRLRENEAIDPPLRNPRLPSGQPKRQSAFGLADLWAGLEPADLSEIRWQPRQWFTTVSPSPVDALAPQDDLVLELAATRPDQATATAGADFMAIGFAVPVRWQVATATTAPQIPPITNPNLPSHQGAIAGSGSLAPVASEQPVTMIAAWRGEQVARVQAFSSPRVEVGQNLPRTNKAALTAVGLKPGPRACAMESPIATVPPPTVEVVSAEMSSPAALQDLAPVSFTAPTLRSSRDIDSLQQRPYCLPAGANEQQCGPAIAHLQPSLPSPWSLVTWAPSLAISSAAPKPSNVCNPAPFEVTADQGHVKGIPPWFPGKRGYRLLPSLPGPNGIAVPEAPAQAPVQLLALTAVPPGSEDTASPDLIRVRVHATPMSILALNLQPLEARAEIGLPLSGPLSEDSLRLASVDSARESFQISSEVPAHSSTVLPAFCSSLNSPVLGLALSNNRAWSEPVPPHRPMRPVAPFSALNRVAGSVAAF
jgi:hypothetical protein